MLKCYFLLLVLAVSAATRYHRRDSTESPSYIDADLDTEALSSVRVNPSLYPRESPCAIFVLPASCLGYYLRRPPPPPARSVLDDDEREEVRRYQGSRDD